MYTDNVLQMYDSIPQEDEPTVKSLSDKCASNQ